MTEIKEALYTRIIHIYGFEHPVSLMFAHMCETTDDTEIGVKYLTYFVEAHEAHPILDEDE